MKAKQYIIVLLVIVALALGLRLNQVTVNPPALSWDEVSIGYNAYSILKIGKDEHGRVMPVDTFISYGDYKPPLAIYVTVPFVALFGLNELAVRLPSVLFGTATVAILYFVVLELLQTAKRNKKILSDSMIQTVALLTSLSVAVSPWHINLSRAGFEANIGLFFIVFGVYLALLARRRPSVWLWTWLPLIACVYTFNSTRYFAPFMGLGLLVYCWKSIIKAKKYVIPGMVIALVALAPIVPHLLSKDAQLRYVEVNIFTDSSIVKTANDRITYDNNSIIAKILHNRRIGYARSFLIHYFDHFTPDFLFIKGDGNPKFSTQEVGQLYLIDLPFLLFGIYCMFTYLPGEALLISYWLLSAIIPAAVARETPHALRILNSLPAWYMFIALGIGMFFYTVVRRRKMLVIILICCVYLLSIAYYLHDYYVHYPSTYSNEWQYGYKQALEYVNQYGNSYNKIYLTEQIGRAYMYTLFYTRYDPAKYLREKKSYFDAAGFYHVDGFDKYVFPTTMPTNFSKGSLYIFPSDQIPPGATIKKIIPLLNGNPYLTIFEKDHI